MISPVSSNYFPVQNPQLSFHAHPQSDNSSGQIEIEATSARPLAPLLKSNPLEATMRASAAMEVAAANLSLGNAEALLKAGVPLNAYKHVNNFFLSLGLPQALTAKLGSFFWGLSAGLALSNTCLTSNAGDAAWLSSLTNLAAGIMDCFTHANKDRTLPIGVGAMWACSGLLGIYDSAKSLQKRTMTNEQVMADYVKPFVGLLNAAAGMLAMAAALKSEEASEWKDIHSLVCSLCWVAAANLSAILMAIEQTSAQQPGKHLDPSSEQNSVYSDTLEEQPSVYFDALEWNYS
jgi:hypothetical protein